MSGFVRINIDDGQLGFISGAGKDFSVRGDDLAPSAEFLRAACIKFRPGSIAADDEDLIFQGSYRQNSRRDLAAEAGGVAEDLNFPLLEY